MKNPKPLRQDAIEVADTFYWQSVESGRKGMEISELILKSKKDFERFERWYEKAKQWVLLKEKR